MAWIASVAPRRHASGRSLTALAAEVGISRQAMTAIEAGRAVPSAAVALRLAAALGCRVEDLFAEPAALPSRPDLAGRRVRLGRVDGRWVAHAVGPAATRADALVGLDGAIDPLEDLGAAAGRALVAGCAPALALIDGDATWLPAASGDALALLAAGSVHVAGLHLAARDRPDDHAALLRRALPEGATLVSLCAWQEGLMVAPGNPRGLRDAADLAAVRLVRRPAGSGAEAALARACGAAPPDGPVAPTHEAAAQAIALGLADAAVGVEPVARAWGLGFVPWAEERFDLALRDGALAHPGVARLLDRLVSAPFRRQVDAVGGYDLSELGATRRVS